MAGPEFMKYNYMSVIDKIKNAKGPLFTFELLAAA